jgi:ferrous iron transport protein B
LIDVPGTYGLHATSKAEEIAVEMLKNADAVINVADATNLERSLHLTMHLLQQPVPLIVALNIWDDAKHKGIHIDPKRLERELGVPVVPTVGVTGEGIKELIERLPGEPRTAVLEMTEEDRWTEVGRILSVAQSLEHRHHTVLEFLGDLSVRPATGMPLAALVLTVSFMLIRLIGESLIGYVFEPLFEYGWRPVLESLGSHMRPGGLLYTLLIGELVNGEIDFVQSFGLLSTGLFVGFGMVFPYVFSFYLVLSFLEDFGYLPRLAVLLDTLMHRLGLHGWAVIPMLLGFGCNVPGIMATRVLESRRERLIASTLVSIAVPCASLQAMMWGILGPYGAQYVAMVYGTLFVVWIVIGRILNRFLAGSSPELIMEIPPYRFPPLRTVGYKLWRRMKAYIKEAVPFVLAGVLVVNFLHFLRVFDFLADATAPVFTNLLGLPKEAGLAILMGFFRKDVAMGMLGALQMTPHQLVISVTVLAMSFPCIATFVVLAREIGVSGLLKAFGIMLISSLAVGICLNAIL